MHRLGFWKWAWGERPWMSLTLTKYPQRVDAVKILGIAFTTPRNVPLHLFGRRLACERANKWLKDIRRRFNLFERGANFVIFNLLHSCAKWLSGPSHCRMKQDIIFPRKHAKRWFSFSISKEMALYNCTTFNSKVKQLYFFNFFFEQLYVKMFIPSFINLATNRNLSDVCSFTFFSVVFYELGTIHINLFSYLQIDMTVMSLIYFAFGVCYVASFVVQQ